MTYLAKLGELTLKGSNLQEFENLLTKNTKKCLTGKNVKIQLRAGRLYIECEEEDCQAVEFTLNHLLGITGWAKTVTCEKSIEAINEAVFEIAKIQKNNESHVFVLPSSNILYNCKESVRDGFRQKMDETFKSIKNFEEDENSNLLLEPRANLGGGRGYPQMRIYKGSIAGQKLPLNKWLHVEAVLPNHVNPDKKFDVKIYEGNSLIFSKKFPYTTLSAKFYALFFIAIGGGNGEIIDISNVRIVPANESKK